MCLAGYKEVTNCKIDGSPGMPPDYCFPPKGKNFCMDRALSELGYGPNSLHNRSSARLREGVMREYLKASGLSGEAISVTTDSGPALTLPACADLSEVTERFSLLLNSVISAYGDAKNPDGYLPAQGGSFERISQSRGNTYTTYVGKPCFQIG